jgi:enolase-phosphatase E1
MSDTEGCECKRVAGLVTCKDASLISSSIPRLSHHLGMLLLDIMGCTTSISSFKEEMIPYSGRQITSYVNRMPVDDMQSLGSDLNYDINCIDDEKIKLGCLEVLSNADLQSAIISCMKKMKYHSVMKNSITVTNFFGNIWADGFASGSLKGHLLKDVLPVFQWLREKNVSLNIYSGGSVQLQK